LFSSDSYYEFALGAVALASSRADDDIAVLKGGYASEATTARRIVWLEFCFDLVLDEKLRPSPEDRNRLLRQFIRMQAHSPLPQP
jgi:hypothetical protein